MSDTLLQIAAHAIVLLTIPFHECAHGVVSLWLGDPTAKRMGRLTLNPLRHLDVMGSLCLLAFGIGWAKPVPIDTRYYKNRKLGMAVSAAAGPVANILLAYFFLLGYKACAWSLVMGRGGEGLQTLCTLLQLVVLVNLNLAVFNLLPIPPFDGSRIFTLFLPQKLYFGIMRYERYFMLIILAIFYLGVLDVPMMWLRGGLLQGLDWASGYVDKIAAAFYT